MVESTEILERGDQAAGLERRQRTFARMAWHHLRSKPLGSIGLIVVLIVAVVAIFADVIAPFDYQAQKYDAVRVAPGATHLFGTDEFGRDVFSRVVHGARVSLLVGFASVLLGTGVGALLGLISGYFMGYPRFRDAAADRYVDGAARPHPGAGHCGGIG